MGSSCRSWRMGLDDRCCPRHRRSLERSCLSAQSSLVSHNTAGQGMQDNHFLHQSQLERHKFQQGMGLGESARRLQHLGNQHLTFLGSRSLFRTQYLQSCRKSRRTWLLGKSYKRPHPQCPDSSQVGKAWEAALLSHSNGRLGISYLRYHQLGWR